MKTQLTAEQSAKLVKSGINANRASIFTPHPIFTLTDLLEILPKEIEVDTCRCGLSIWYHNANYWIVSYVQYSGYEISYQAMSHESKELIDALYSLTLECANNNHSNKE